MPTNAKIIDAANAIVAALAAAVVAEAFSTTFTARRRYIPRIDVKDAGTVFATVVPKAIRTEQVTRAHVFKEFDIDLAIQKRLPATSNPEDESGLAAGDALMLLAEEVLDFFEAGTDYGGSRLTRVPDALVPFLPEHLQNDKTFTTVMTLTLKLL